MKTNYPMIMPEFGTVLDSVVENGGPIVTKIIGILLIFFGAQIVLKLVTKLTDRQIEKSKEMPELQARRVQTMMTMTRSTMRYVIYAIAALMILAHLGFSQAINNLILSAGIGSLALGFGAQSLVRDVVTGFFMMFEKQFSVGDFVKLDDAEGVVTATAMRVTYLRNNAGQQIIIPNGTINRVINYSRNDSLAKVTVGTPYEEDSRKVMEIMNKAAQDYAKEHEDVIVSAPVVQGITELGDSSVNITVICRTRPLEHWGVERGLRLALKEALDKEGISIPYPQQEVLIKK